jgi:hypothetical protein
MPTARQFPLITLLFTTLTALSLLFLYTGTVLAGDDSPVQVQLRERAAYQNHTQIALKLQTQTRARLGDSIGNPPANASALGDQDRTRDRDQDGDRTWLRDRLRIRDCELVNPQLLRLWTLLGMLP